MPPFWVWNTVILWDSKWRATEFHCIAMDNPSVCTKDMQDYAHKVKLHLTFLADVCMHAWSGCNVCLCVCPTDWSWGSREHHKQRNPTINTKATAGKLTLILPSARRVKVRVLNRLFMKLHKPSVQWNLQIKVPHCDQHVSGIGKFELEKCPL